MQKELRHQVRSTRRGIYMQKGLDIECIQSEDVSYARRAKYWVHPTRGGSPMPEGVRHRVHSIGRAFPMQEGVRHRVHSIRRGSPTHKVLDIENTHSDVVVLCTRGWT